MCVFIIFFSGLLDDCLIKIIYVVLEKIPKILTYCHNVKYSSTEVLTVLILLYMHILTLNNALFYSLRKINKLSYF